MEYSSIATRTSWLRVLRRCRGRRAIRRRIAQEQLGDMRVVIERVPAIERTERGKFRAVVSRLPSEVRAQALYQSLTNA